MDKKAAIGAGIAVAAALALLLRKSAEAGPCTPGETKCDGLDLYVCNSEGEWELDTVNAPECEVAKPDIQLIDASWDKDTYAPGETAILTATFKNPTGYSWNYASVAGYSGVSIEQDFSILPGGEYAATYPMTVPDYTSLVYIRAYVEDQSVRTFETPDLVVVPGGVTGAAFIMIGGISNEAVWEGDPRTGHYTMKGTVMNVGDTEGSQEVVGWWRVGNYGAVHDAFKEVITLQPGETREVFYTITGEEMFLAQMAAGNCWHEDHTRVCNYEWLAAFVSTPDHAQYGNAFGWIYTLAFVHFPG